MHASYPLALLWVMHCKTQPRVAVAMALMLPPLYGCQRMRGWLAILILPVAGCDGSLDRPIHFNIPNGFQGPFVIVSNPAYTDVIAKYYDRYQVTVPQDGVIRTKSIDIFTRWHKTSAAYEDGKPFPAYDPGSYQLHSGPTGTSDNKTYISWYYVGPYNEFKEFMYGDVYQRKLTQWLNEHGITY